MESVRRRTALAMAVLLVVALMSASALAEGTRSNAPSTLKPGKWYATSGTTTLLSVKFSKDAVLTVNWKGNTQARLSMSLYKDADRKNFLDALNTSETASGTQGFVLRKGTYYVSFYDPTKAGQVKFTVAALKDYRNYCPSRAIAMKRGVKYLHGAHTPMNSFEYDWFKITLTRKQRITVYCSTNINPVTFRNKDLLVLKSEAYTKKAYRTIDVLNPGTYYVRIYNNWITNAFETRANTVFWK